VFPISRLPVVSDCQLIALFNQQPAQVSLGIQKLLTLAISDGKLAFSCLQSLAIPVLASESTKNRLFAGIKPLRVLLRRKPNLDCPLHRLLLSLSIKFTFNSSQDLLVVCVSDTKGIELCISLVCLPSSTVRLTQCIGD
jgi:hypothetical protein